jgi:hypothetical protein
MIRPDSRGRPSTVVVGFLSTLALLAVLLFPARASATDPVTRIPRTEDGPGIKVGERTTFHPGFALSIGYDSNIFWRAPNESRPGAAFAAPSAWLNIGNRKVRDGLLDSPARQTIRKVDYFVGASASWRAYLSGLEEVRHAGKLNIDAIARLSVLPGRRFQFDFDEDFNRLAEPMNFPALREQNFNRLLNDAALRFIIRPGGGRLSLSFAYRNQLQFFETGNLPEGNRIVNGVEHETRWRFRDRTGVALRYSMHHTLYLCCAETGTGRNEDNDAHRITVGFVGQVARKWALDVFAGWGLAFYRNDISGKEASNFSGFIGHGAVSYFPTVKSQIQFRVYRTFSDTLFGNYFSDIGGEITGKHTFRTRTTLYAGASVFGRWTEALPQPTTDPNPETDLIESYINAPGLTRQDLMFAGVVQLEQALGKYFVLALRYHATLDETDFAVVYVGGPTDYLRFNRHMVMLIAAVRY